MDKIVQVLPRVINMCDRVTELTVKLPSAQEAAVKQEAKNATAQKTLKELGSDC